ncbi:MAG: alpha/beta fold hydrolase [Erysipelotrichaceae bacterium]
MIAKTFETKESSLHYLISSGYKEETLLFLHAEFTDSSIFITQFEAFADDYRIVAVDMPGHGKSYMKHGDIGLADYPNQLIRLLESEGIRRVHLIGVSLGAIMAQSLAQRYPKHIDSLTCIGTYSIHHGYPGDAKLWRLDPWRGWILLFDVARFREKISEEAAISPLGRKIFKEGTKSFKRSTFSGMQDLRPLFNGQKRKSRLPLLILCGEEDSPVIRESSIRLCDISDRSTYGDIPQAGHVANLDQPKIFNRMLRKFLDDFHR